LIDVRPFAHGLHHYILNRREFYNLPRKFNVAFEGGGSVDTVADTNDIGFMACIVGQASSLSRSAGFQPAGENDETGRQDAGPTNTGIYFRVELCGITGHKQLASDCGIVVKPNEAVAVAAAMLRVFIENGERTDRKKA